MAKFFVSYSRSVKDEVKKVVDLLCASGHEVWWDGDIPIMADWWATILKNIEWCDTFIFVTSEKSVESAYCIAELKYANDRQRPILPFILDDPSQYTLPPELPSRGQWLMYNGDPAQMLSQINYAMNEIDRALYRDTNVPRPPEPMTGGKSLTKQFQEAIRLGNQAKFEEAKQLLRNVKSLDYGEWGDLCDRWIEQLNRYAAIVDLADDESTISRADEYWQAYLKDYGRDFDPQNIDTKLSSSQKSSNIPFIPIIGGVIILAIIVLTGLALANANSQSVVTPTPQQIAEVATDSTTDTALSEDSARETGVAQAIDTLTALAPTNTLTITPTYTDTPISSNDVQNTARAETFSQATLTAKIESTIAQQTQHAVQTQQFIAGSTATYSAQLSLTPPATSTPEPPTLSPIDIARTPVTANDNWIPHEEEIDGVTMVLVPAGQFIMGSTNEEIASGFEFCQQALDNDADCRRNWYESEAQNGDNTQIFTEPFWIDKYEVSRAQYLECVNDTVCTETPDSDYSSDPEQPINPVTWDQARIYCEYRDSELPTDAEWEYVARGPDRLLFPWGNEFDGTEANHCDGNCGEQDWASNYIYENDDGYAVTAPVTAYEQGESWVGTRNMAGNVWEWTSSLFGDYPYDNSREDNNNESDVRVLRGGSFFDTVYGLSSANRFWGLRGITNNDYGIRCAHSVAPADTMSTQETSQAELTKTPIMANDDWVPYKEVIDGVTMVLVPKGCFMMGSTDEEIDYVVNESGGNRLRFSNEQPIHEQCFDEPFWIDQTEITQADFERLGGTKEDDNRFDGDNLPVEDITWFEAKDFCESNGGRLPTEREWEYAARGPDNLIYPWGDDWNENYAVWWDNSGGQTAPVGSRSPESASWVGAMDMSGNVSEWVSSLYEDYEYDTSHESDTNSKNSRVFRDSSWLNSDTTDLRTSSRHRWLPISSQPTNGFRCARSY